MATMLGALASKGINNVTLYPMWDHYTRVMITRTLTFNDLFRDGINDVFYLEGTLGYVPDELWHSSEASLSFVTQDGTETAILERKDLKAL